MRQGPTVRTRASNLELFYGHGNPQSVSPYSPYISPLVTTTELLRDNVPLDAGDGYMHQQVCPLIRNQLQVAKMVAELTTLIPNYILIQAHLVGLTWNE